MISSVLCSEIFVFLSVNLFPIVDPPLIWVLHTFPPASGSLKQLNSGCLAQGRHRNTCRGDEQTLTNVLPFFRPSYHLQEFESLLTNLFVVNRFANNSHTQNMSRRGQSEVVTSSRSFWDVSEGPRIPFHNTALSCRLQPSGGRGQLGSAR